MIAIYSTCIDNTNVDNHFDESYSSLDERKAAVPVLMPFAAKIRWFTDESEGLRIHARENTKPLPKKVDMIGLLLWWPVNSSTNRAKVKISQMSFY